MQKNLRKIAAIGSLIMLVLLASCIFYDYQNGNDANFHSFLIWIPCITTACIMSAISEVNKWFITNASLQNTLRVLPLLFFFASMVCVLAGVAYLGSKITIHPLLVVTVVFMFLVTFVKVYAEMHRFKEIN